MNRDLKITYTIVSIIVIISMVVMVGSGFLTIGLIGRSDFYAIELKQVMPEPPTYIKIAPIIFVVTTIISAFGIKAREVLRDVYRERKHKARTAR